MKTPRATREAYQLLHEGALALADVEHAGLRIDVDYLDKATRKTERKITALEAELRADREVFPAWEKTYGDKLKIGSLDQLTQVLFGSLGIPYQEGWEKTATGRYRADEEVIGSLDLPFARNYIRKRKLEKLKGTYLDGIRREMVNGFVHPVYNVHLVETFRRCIAKGTMIEVVRDVSKHPEGIPIEKVRAGDYAYCFDNSLKLNIRKVLWSGKTGRKRVIRLHWSSRQGKGHLDLTPEHRVRLSSGKYVQARNLTKGMDFRTPGESKHSPKIRTLSVARDGDRLYVTGGTDPILDHRLVYESLVGDLETYQLVHHRDNNHLNNTPSNLERMTKSEHVKHHAPENLTEEARRKRLRQRIINHQIHGDRWNRGNQCHNWIEISKFGLLKRLAKAKGRPTRTGMDFGLIKSKAALLGVDLLTVRDRYSRKGRYVSLGWLRRNYRGLVRDVVQEFRFNYQKAERMLRGRKLEFSYVQESRNPWGRAGKPNNHKIIRVEQIDQVTDVYDLEVEEFHNYIAGGICVHNSCDSPNLQNQMNRDPEMAPILRKCYIPRESGWCLTEPDFGAIEFRGAACKWKDPKMIEYASDPSKDIHRDEAMNLFMMRADQVGKKTTRDWSKNRFVFPILYGSYHKKCAAHIWEAVEDERNKVEGSDISVKEHLRRKGIYSRGACEHRQDSIPGTYEHHVKKVEDSFNQRFPGFGEGKKKWWEEYLERGWFRTMTGFIIQGVFSRNFLLNADIQGSMSHCLQWSLTRVQKELRRRKAKSLVVCEIHDCLLLDGPENEVPDVLELCERVMTKDVREHWDWIIVPLTMEADVSPPGMSWSDKKPWVNSNGSWRPKG